MAPAPDLIPKLAAAVLPVCLFLTALIYLDSYKLVPLRRIVGVIALGGVLAGAAWVLNGVLFSDEQGAHPLVVAFGAALVEEILKAIPIVWLLGSRRIAFLVDAAICGFAVGTGFALVENVYYLVELPHSPVMLWLVRGFGTAVMHGGVTAIFAIMATAFATRFGSRRRDLFVPGLALAVLVHALFNQYLTAPIVTTALVLVLLPPLMVLVFIRSERSLESWLSFGFDVDAEMLRLLQSGNLSESAVGLYLKSLRDRLRGEVLADMVCYLRVRAELSLRAKGILMMRESGHPVPPDPSIRAKLEELRWLAKSIGPTGRLALAPLLARSAEDLWELTLLESRAP
ncbi:MAG TPA: PrsW family glutamic-type intramembrane protease [Thermoanaerobaculia bacterium]|nr:PrsW family glutamic-type intramembrane protease [Thermoanaerobaculia bacterium]